MPLLTAAQLAAVRQAAELGMVTPVVIRRRSVAEGDYGDDEPTYTPVASVKGWLYSRPTPIQEEAGGRLITANTYRLLLPVGTDILPGDEVTIGGETFVVSDTTAESTWNPMLKASLRRAE